MVLLSPLSEGLQGDTKLGRTVREPAFQDGRQGRTQMIFTHGPLWEPRERYTLGAQGSKAEEAP